MTQLPVLSKCWLLIRINITCLDNYAIFVLISFFADWLYFSLGECSFMFLMSYFIHFRLGYLLPIQQPGVNCPSIHPSSIPAYIASALDLLSQGEGGVQTGQGITRLTHRETYTYSWLWTIYGLLAFVIILFNSNAVHSILGDSKLLLSIHHDKCVEISCGTPVRMGLWSVIKPNHLLPALHSNNY